MTAPVFRLVTEHAERPTSSAWYSADPRAALAAARGAVREHGWTRATVRVEARLADGTEWTAPIFVAEAPPAPGGRVVTRRLPSFAAAMIAADRAARAAKDAR